MTAPTREAVMDPNELHVLKAIARDDLALVGGYEPELATLRAAGLIAMGGGGWLLTDRGREALAGG
jgi:hypothetical protein